MPPLAFFLIAKISVALVVVAGPFLILSKARLDDLSGFGAPTLAF